VKTGVGRREALVRLLLPMPLETAGRLALAVEETLTELGWTGCRVDMGAEHWTIEATPPRSGRDDAPSAAAR
jgi:hypothetical protein